MLPITRERPYQAAVQVQACPKCGAGASVPYIEWCKSEVERLWGHSIGAMVRRNEEDGTCWVEREPW